MEATRLGLSDDELRRIAARYFADTAEPDVQIRQSTVDHFSAVPSGFLAEHYALRIVADRGDEQSEELCFFLKVAPQGNVLLDRYHEEVRVFRKEIRVLSDMLTPIQRLVHWRTVAPRLFFTKAERLLVMENMKLQGYDIVHGTDGMLGPSHIEQALETLALLHAGSIVFEERCGKRLPELCPGVLDENAWIEADTSLRTQDVDNVIRLYQQLIGVSKRWTNQKLTPIQHKLPTLVRRIYKFVQPSEHYRNSCNHGDLWKNNLLFRYSPDQTPTGCVLVDFQMSRYVPPAYDINLILALATSREYRDQSRSKLLRLYYGHFTDALRRNQIDPDSVYPWDVFLRSCEDYRLAGLIHSALISVEVTLPEVFLRELLASPELSGRLMPEPKMALCIKAFQADTVYRDHILELMEELVEYIAE